MIKKKVLSKFEYREGSDIARLFDRLKSGKSVSKKHLFKDIDSPGYPFRRLRRHGKERRAFRIEVKDDKVRLIAA